MGCDYMGCVVSAGMRGTSTTRVETDYWYPRLQQWTGSTWKTILTSDTDRWYSIRTSATSTTPFQAFTIYPPRGHWYRILAFYYWPPLNYETGGEPTAAQYVPAI